MYTSEQATWTNAHFTVWASLQHSLAVSSSSIGPRTPEVLTKPLHQEFTLPCRTPVSNALLGRVSVLQGTCTCNEISFIHSFIHVHIYVIATCKAQLQHCFKLERKLFTVYVAIFFQYQFLWNFAFLNMTRLWVIIAAPNIWHQLSVSLCYKQPSALRSKQYRLNPDVIGLNVY